MASEEQEQKDENTTWIIVGSIVGFVVLCGIGLLFLYIKVSKHNKKVSNADANAQVRAGEGAVDRVTASGGSVLADANCQTFRKSLEGKSRWTRNMTECTDAARYTSGKCRPPWCTGYFTKLDPKCNSLCSGIGGGCIKAKCPPGQEFHDCVGCKPIE